MKEHESSHEEKKSNTKSSWLKGFIQQGVWELKKDISEKKASKGDKKNSFFKW